MDSADQIKYEAGSVPWPNQTLRIDPPNRLSSERGTSEVPDE